jgi:aspartate/methionine/tyrosine aminotransferase
MFSLTGWRVGWLVSENEKLVAASRAIHAYATFCAPVPLQIGVAAALDEDLGFSKSIQGITDSNHGVMTSTLFARNAAKMTESLMKQGLSVTEAEGGYFLVADISATGLVDADFCRQLVKHAKVGCIPLSVFYDENQSESVASSMHPLRQRPAVPTSFVRFSICKTAELIDEACSRIDGVQLCSDEFKQ